MKYYKINEDTVINTANIIPDDMLEKKGLLKYKLNTVKIPDTEDKPEDYGKVVKKVYNWYRHVHYHIPTFEEVKTQKFGEIKNTYQTIMNGGFECSNGIKLDCRESDKINWLMVKLQGGVVESIKDFNNNIHTLEPEVVMTMMTELEEYYKKILSDKWEIEELVKNANTIEEVNDIYWKYNEVIN